MSNNLKLTVSEIIEETPDTKSIYFDAGEKIADFFPGQFLTFILKVNGENVRRSYSICTPPHMLPRIGVSVKRVVGGLVSNHLLDNLKVGDELDLIEPYGNFNINHKRDDLPDLVLFGGGSGITPLMSIILSSLKNQNNRIFLFYGNRNERSIIFRERLEELRSQFPDRLFVEHLLSRPDALGTRSQRLTSSMVKELLTHHNLLMNSEANYYVCGPQGYMETVLEELPLLGIEKERIHKESFFSGTDPKADLEDLNRPEPSEMPDEQMVKVIYDGETWDVTVPKGEYILDCALDLGIDLPYACQSGICGMCRATKVQGELLIHDQEAISEEEIEEGACLTCCAEPMTSDVVINYDL